MRHVRAAWTVLVVIVLAATAGCTHHDAVAPPTSTAAASTAPVSTSTPTPTPTETQDSNVAAAETALEAFIDAYNATYNNHMKDWRTTVLPLTGGQVQKDLETELSWYEEHDGWAEGGLKIEYYASESYNEPQGAVDLQVCIDGRGVVRHYVEGTPGIKTPPDTPYSLAVEMKRQPGGAWVVWVNAEGSYPCS